MKRLFSILLCAMAPAQAWSQAATDANSVFRVNARLVEVYATVRDHDGRYLDFLPKERFEIRDNGEPQPVASFESNAERLSCAVLLDTTGSMAEMLPVVKNSVVRMIDALRDEDSIAVYSFTTALNRLQDFTSDKAAAKQAVLRTRAGGATALFDAISQLAHEIESQNGKKAIVVFTDGDDNASLLNARAAVQRAKKSGVPVYAIAEGEALGKKELLNELKDIADTTGAQSYEAYKSSDIARIFQEITADLQHTYMLAYRPPAASGQRWRTIELMVTGVKGAKIRAKQGYVPE
jgi:Ca-activated chloride channel homolog